MDLHACLAEPLIIPAGENGKVPTGIAIELPGPEMVALVFPRSGLASKHGISLSNAVGVIDSDYRGEIICLIKNDSRQDFTVQPGDRIAQIAFFPIYRASWEPVNELNDSARGEGGFGSTGIGFQSK
jgi:dUTP pyrophosphatase